VKRQRGFTLLELLVVLVIGVLLVSLAPPLLSGLSGATELRGAARQLAAGLRGARNAAVSRQREATLTLDLEQRRFGVTGDPREIVLPEGLGIRLYTAQAEVVDAATGGIRFFPDGSSTGGSITVSGSKRAYRVSVDWLTGAIAIVEEESSP
jgi:general secretion pathway protein H